MSAWISFTTPATPVRARLLCLPYAGGSASIFRDWSSIVPRGVEVLAAQYPGRERRWKEPLVTRMEALVPPLREELRTRGELPFVIFGHSMGALVAFELTRSLQAAGMPLPGHLFVSASAAPEGAFPRNRLAELDDASLIEALRKLNGIPEEALAAPGLMELMLPVLRADLELADTYRPREEAPLECALTAVGGLEDVSVPREALSGWARLSARPASVRMLRGDHFYLRRSQHDLLALLLAPLAPILGARD